MPPFDAKEISLCAVGDLSLGDSPKMLGIGVRSATMARGGDYLFGTVLHELNADLIFGNLEGVISDVGYCHNFKQAQLRGGPEMGAVLSRAGFNVINVANNHTMQHGPEAFKETCQVLRDQGIAVIGQRGEDGWQAKPVILQVEGIRVGFLGYSNPDGYGHQPLFALNQPEAVLHDVGLMRPLVDKLVVSLHWGDEFVRCPSTAQLRYARKIIESGADIILGHHSHVIQRVELYCDGWICYSLGNFISDMVWNSRTQEGIVVKFNLGRRISACTYVGLVSIDKWFSPRIEPIDPIVVRSLCAADEGATITEDKYLHLQKERVKENRRLAHLFLIRNFFRYSPSNFIRVLLNSLKSLLGLV